MINADWVQLNCRVKPIPVRSCKLEYGPDKKPLRVSASGFDYATVFTDWIVTNQPPFHKDYKVELQPMGTSINENVYFVSYKSAMIATVLTDIRPGSCIDLDTVFVKFENKFLYGEKLYERVTRFLEDNGLEFHNWTRFDVCCDFNRFLDGRERANYKPEKLINDYMRGKIGLLNRRRGAKRKGCMWFEDGAKGIEIESLRLGSKFSAVNVKLYNKTRELAQVKDKPYIREQWGLNPDIDIQKEVWRLEFKIKDFNTVAIENDELKMSLKTLDILKDENTTLLWNVLREHYFEFYKEDGTKNVTRKRKLKLFDHEPTGVKLSEISGKEDTTRAHKIFIKRMLLVQQQLRTMKEMSGVAFATDYVAAHLVYKHDLKEWAASRFPGWKYENYEEPPTVEIPVVQYTLNMDGTKRVEKHKFSY